MLASCNGDMWSLYHRGLSYVEMGKSDKAVADFSEFERRGDAKWRSSALLQRADCYFSEGRRQHARNDLDAVFRIRPDAFSYRCRGRLNYESGVFSLALDDYDQALKLDPADAVSYVGRGCAHWRWATRGRPSATLPRPSG